MWADNLPKTFEDANEDDDRRLFYVGLTRPEDFLVISASSVSKFITEIENSGKVDIA
jgi:superfamily I DNA/RNA helicase